MKTLKSLSIASRLVLAAAALPATFACSAEPGSVENEAVGTIALPLTATSAAGTRYALVNGTFQLTGPQNTTLFGDPESGSTLLTEDLLVGTYNISLQAGWQVQRINSDSSMTALDATLVSPVTQGFTIVDGSTTGVEYVFRVGADVVTFGRGDLNVTFTVQETPTCTAPEVDCAGVCVDLATSEQNCGSCGAGCAQGESCIAGRCDAGTPVCSGSELLCAGTCVDPASDNANCGACANVCGAGTRCLAGTCEASALSTFTTNLDPSGMSPFPWGPATWLAQTAVDDCTEGCSGAPPFSPMPPGPGMCVRGTTTLGDTADVTYLGIVSMAPPLVGPTGEVLHITLSGTAPAHLNLVAFSNQGVPLQAEYPVGALNGTRTVDIPLSAFSCPAWAAPSDCLTNAALADGFFFVLAGGLESAPFDLCVTSLSVDFR